jgi:hypothetical protein
MKKLQITNIKKVFVLCLTSDYLGNNNNNNNNIYNKIIMLPNVYSLLDIRNDE